MEESNVKPVRKYRSKAAVLKILQDQVQSGQNIKSFCEARGIAGGTFHRWKQKYSAEEDHSKESFATLHITPERGLFAIVGSIKIYQPVSASYLKELLA